MAAELIDAGVEPHEVYRRLYEDLPFRRLQLLQRALSTVERHDEGVITISHLVKDDYEQTGAQETDSEGVVDHMRSVEGTAVAVLVRELLSDDRDGMRKVSLRATDGRVDVSRIAREFGGGGHPQAAGFTTALPYRELVEKLRASTCATSSDRGPSSRAKPAGVTSHDVVAEVRRSLPRATKVGHAGTLDPFATGLLLVLVGRATRAQRFLMACQDLPRGGAARVDVGHRRPRRRARAHRPAAGTARDPGRRPASAPARLLGREDRRGAGLRARAAGGGRGDRAAPGDRLPRRPALRTRGAAPSSRSSARRAPTCAR